MSDSDYSGVRERERSLLMATGDARPRSKKRKPRQEISAFLKWTVFLINFLVFLSSTPNSVNEGRSRPPAASKTERSSKEFSIPQLDALNPMRVLLFGVAVLALGVYLFIKEYAEVKLMDIILNPAILIALIGFIICVVSMMGFVGALRDNIFMLRAFSLCIFFCYIVVVCLTFIIFILFYSDTTEGVSAHSLLLYAIKNYHTNRNLAEIMDSLQENLECCGVSSVAQGYRDWNLSYQYNCSTSNPYPEKCGVPYSCCRKSVISEAAGSSNPLLPAMRSLECWQNALQKRPQDLEHDLHTRGCLHPLKTVFESHAIHIGAAVAVVIIPVCLSVCLVNILAKQIDHQKFLLEREAKRNERRRKRDVKDRPERGRQRQVSLDQLEEGKLPSFDPNVPPKLPDNPPPSRPPGEGKTGKVRASSSSPKRKMTGEGRTRGDEKRKRSTTTPQQQQTDKRVRQWVLQQSDLVSSAPPK